MSLADAAALLQQIQSKREIKKKKKQKGTMKAVNWVLIDTQKLLNQTESDLHGA